MKTMILVLGASNRGKSQSIKRLAMKMPFSSLIRPWRNDDYDSFVIGTVNDKADKEHIIGIESQGDPGSNQILWIQECIKADCKVIVAACRSYGQTYNDACQLARDNGYEVIEVTTHYHRDDSILSNGIDLRDVFAENMVNLILNLL